MNDIFGDDPNFLFIDDRNIDPEELIENYVEALKLAGTKKGIRELLWGFLSEVQYMTLRQWYIDQAKANLGNLEMLEKEVEMLYDEADEDEED
jgi:hypothetical protein